MERIICPKIVVERVANSDNEVQYRLSNNSVGDFWYYHFVSFGPAPVPYCQYSADVVKICAPKVMVSDDGHSEWIHIGSLIPGASVEFSVLDVKTQAVGVKGRCSQQTEGMLWSSAKDAA